MNFKTWTISACFSWALFACSMENALAREGHWVFRVFLDQKEIGYHKFEVSDSATGRQVRVDARFDIKVLFFNAYSYSHQNRETWAGGCLTSIDAVTDDNGDELLVTGGQLDNGFKLETAAGAVTHNASCLRSFAYWDPVFLDSRQLLNSQTGEIVEVDIQSLGLQSLQIGATSFEAEQYAIKMEDGTISLWYDAHDGRWLALEAPARGGRTIRYEPVILPGTTEGVQARLVMD